MSRHRSTGDSSSARGVPSSSDAALHTTQLVEQLARSIISERSGVGHGSDVVPSEVQVHGAVRLCIRILTSHIGEPLMAEDEASIAQSIRTRLVKVRGHHVREGLTAVDYHLVFQILNLGPCSPGPAAKESECMLRAFLCVIPVTPPLMR